MSFPTKALVLLACLVVQAESVVHATVSYRETATTIEVSNDDLLFRLNKTDRNLLSLQLDGQELIGNGGSGYFDLNDSRFGYFVLGHHEKSVTTYPVRSGTDFDGVDFLDVAILHPATTAMPFTIKHHYILRDGERGIHMFTEYSHSAAMPADSLGQTRFVLRGDPNIFTYVSVEDDPIGAPWRRSASLLPTPADLIAAVIVQDATYDLSATGSAYPRRYYTKYDWSVYQKDHQLHGLYGNGYGAWVVQGYKDSLNGGPMKQNLTLHQTETTPVLLNMLQSGHYGSKAVLADGDWSKTYGPFFLYFNSGADGDALRADAAAYATPAFDQSFYDALDIPGFVKSRDRSRVKGRINLSTGDSMAGTTIVLSENNLESQRSAKGYQFWADVEPDGTFTLTRVRPRTYRLSAYRPGVFGAYELDDVIVGTGATVTLPELTWTPETSGTVLWQIGFPDRTAAEFKNGDNFRNYGLQFSFDTDFPNGVNYIVGQSNDRDDWNYVQYKSINGVDEPDWHVQFDLDSAPEAGLMATLTVALAAVHSTRDLTIFVNGLRNRFDWSIPAEDSSSVAHRSGVSGLYLLHKFTFDASLLVAGTNGIDFHLPSGSDNVLHDAIRLEVRPPE